jgi:hypothetical protein
MKIESPGYYSPDSSHFISIVMCIWKSVVELNNAGVALLLQNKNRAAVRLFAESLSLIRKTTLTTQQQGPESTGPSMHDATYALYNLHDEHWFIWNEVFMISDRRDNERCLLFARESQTVYTGMIMFNIALIYHRQSKLGKRFCLVKAERIYLMVVTLLGCASYNKGTALIVKLAALNNLSLIKHEQNNFDASRRAFGQLVRTVNLPATQLPPTSLVNVNSMLLNGLLIFCHPQLAPAA